MIPFDYQTAGAEFLYKRKYAILADTMGLGKSFTALLATTFHFESSRIFAPEDRACIIAPAFLLDTWKNEIEKCIPTYKEKFSVYSYNYITTNYHLLKQFNLVIIDEIHSLKNPKAKRTNNIIAAICKYKPEFVFGLSGTPIKNKIPEFFTLIYLMYSREPDKFPYSYTRFCDTFSNQVIVDIGKRKVFKYEGHKNLEGLKQLLRPIYMRRTLNDVSQELPEMIRKEVFIDSNESQDKLKEAWESYQQNKNEVSFATVKMNNAILKAEYTASYVDTILEECSDQALIIFSDHVDSARSIFDILKKRLSCVCITGSTPMRMRNIFVESFNKGTSQVLIATIGTMSVGYTLTRSNQIILNDLPWVSTDLDQAEKRIHRLGQTRTCFIHFISYGKVDSYINRKLMFKRELLKEVL